MRVLSSAERVGIQMSLPVPGTTAGHPDQQIEVGYRARLNVSLPFEATVMANPYAAA